MYIDACIHEYRPPQALTCYPVPNTLFLARMYTVPGALAHRSSFPAHKHRTHISPHEYGTRTHTDTHKDSALHTKTHHCTHFFLLFFFNLTYSRWTSSLPSCLWSLRIFPSLPGSRLTIVYRDASSAILQLVNQWLNFTYSRSYAFRYGRKNTNLTW